MKRFYVPKSIMHKFNVSSSKHNKYNASKKEVDGFTFQSKLEATHYKKLCLLQKNKEVLFFLRQVPFHICKGVTYRVDFIVFWADGNITFEDVKGYRTKEYLIKKKLVEDKYPIKIIERR